MKFENPDPETWIKP